MVKDEIGKETLRYHGGKSKVGGRYTLSTKLKGTENTMNLIYSKNNCVINFKKCKKFDSD